MMDRRLERRTERKLVGRRGQRAQRIAQHRRRFFRLALDRAQARAQITVENVSFTLRTPAVMAKSIAPTVS